MDIAYLRVRFHSKKNNKRRGEVNRKIIALLFRQFIEKKKQDKPENPKQSWEQKPKSLRVGNK
jgi:hypothetical protein